MWLYRDVLLATLFTHTPPPPQLMVFDLEFGAVAANTPLPHGMAPFDRVLTSMSGQPHGQPLGMFDRGMGVLTVLHRDASVSAWERVGGALTFRYGRGRGVGCHRVCVIWYVCYGMCDLVCVVYLK